MSRPIPRMGRLFVRIDLWVSSLPARMAKSRVLSGRRDGERRVLVRVREHLFLSGGASRRRARRKREACALSGVRSCSGRSSWRKAGATPRSTSIPPRAATCGATSSGTCAAMGVPLKRPEPFPQPSLLAARVALALEDDERSDFSRRVFVAEFGQGLTDRRSRRRSAPLLAACGVDPATAFERAESEANKARLRAECARAVEIGIVGAPCLVTADRRGVLGQRPA